MKRNRYRFLVIISLVWLIAGGWGRPRAKSNEAHQIFMPLIRNIFHSPITRISVAPDGTEGNGKSYVPSISADGRYIAFHSSSTNLVPNDLNNHADIFVYDQQTKEMALVSLSSNGAQGNKGSWEPVISANGRYVAFASEATNLVNTDTNDMLDVFVHDRQTGETKRVSVASDGSEGDDFSSWHAISADGRYISFASWATTLVVNDINNEIDVFVHDQQTGQTSRVSVNSIGMEGNRGSAWSSISGDGHYIVFHSSATNLVANDTNNAQDVFVHDQQTHQTYRVSMVYDRTEGNNYSGEPFISTDGRYLVFSSLATNLVENDSNDVEDVFVHDLWDGETDRVSISSTQTEGNDHSSKGVISLDGRFVTFYSGASNLVVGDTNGVLDVFLHDRSTGETKRVSVAADGTDTNGHSSSPAISFDGRYITFFSWASNIVGNDTNSFSDVFLFDLGAVNGVWK